MKERLSVSIDAYLLEEGRAAVAAGQHHNLSAWVSAALREQSEHDQRLRAGAEFFEWYEAEYGAFTEEEMERAHRDHEARAIVVDVPDDDQDLGSDAAGSRRSA
jgi:Arc/MetJ-type ribon-helix-helix transcriptional regulator